MTEQLNDPDLHPLSREEMKQVSGGEARHTQPPVDSFVIQLPPADQAVERARENGRKTVKARDV